MNHLTVNDLQLEKVTNAKQIPLITTGTGTGKTTLATSKALIKALEKHYSHNISYALMLEPITVVKDATLENHQTDTIYLSSEELLAHDSADERLRVACFATLGNFIKDGNTIVDVPDLLILDEIDMLAKWTLCFPEYLPVWDWIFQHQGEMLVLGMTATPQLLTEYVHGIEFVDVTPQFPVNYVAESIEVVSHSSAYTHDKYFIPDADNKALYYEQGAKQCAQMARRKDNAGFLVSTHNQDTLTKDGTKLNELMNAQKVKDKPFGETTLLEYVRKHEELPAEIDSLYMNDAYLVGMNVKDKACKHLVCESTDIATVIQFLGRVRHDVASLTVAYNGKNRRTFFANLDRAREFFTNPNIDLETWNVTEQQAISKAQAANKSLDVDILTYRTAEGVRMNPFAKAYYEYQFDIYKALETPESAKAYFNKHLSKYSRTGVIKYTTAKEAQARAHNAEAMRNVVVPDEYLGRKLFKDDTAELVALFNLKDAERHNYKWPTLRDKLISLGYKIHYSGNSRAVNPRNGKRQRYYVIERSM